MADWAVGKSCHRKCLPDAPAAQACLLRHRWEQQPGHTQAAMGGSSPSGFIQGIVSPIPLGPRVRGTGLWEAGRERELSHRKEK